MKAAAPTALICLLLSPPAGAQTVRGTVTDADYHRPITGADVFLLDTLGAAIDSTTTDESGTFGLAAPGPGRFILQAAPDGFLSFSTRVSLAGGEIARLDIEMPVVSTAAARVMGDVIDREAAFQLPWDEFCEEPVRPWEAGILVGVARTRTALEPVPRAVIRLEPLDDEASDRPRNDAEARSWPRTRVTTSTGSFWFCNVPPGRARLVARADGFAADTSFALIRAGTVSWYDALLR